METYIAQIAVALAISALAIFGLAGAGVLHVRTLPVEVRSQTERD